MPNRLRGAFAKLVIRAAAALAAGLVLLPGTLAAQEFPAMPRSTNAPVTVQHAEYVVEVNRKGQVVRVRSAKHASDPSFDARVNGNALQVFIRRPDGSAVAGIYRLTYDYNPKTKEVTRHVALVQAGGVDPNALGAVDQLRRENAKTLHHPPSPLPDFSPAASKP